MINPGRSYNLDDYKEIFLRRKLYFVVPLVVVFLGACLVAALTPRKYMASTLVLVTPPRIPAELVRSTVTSGITERLNSISQEIMSRTRLEAVIDELKLFPEETKKMDREALVALMRQNIKVDIPQRTSENVGYFAIKYTSKDPVVAAAVANKLSSLFIEENLKQREQQAVGTSEFLANELKTTKEKLEAQGKELADYKRKYLGELPEQRDTNIRLLEQIQLQYQRNEESLRAAQDRQLLIGRQMRELENPSVQTGEGAAGTRTRGSFETQLDDMKKNLAELQSRYTERHPDVVSLKRKIAEMEKRKEVFNIKNDPRYRELANTMTTTDLEIKRLQEESGKLRAQMGQYRGRIEGATVREQQMSSLVQEYENTKRLYESLLKKSEEAQQAENLERRQKGEQFRVVDPARVPEKPFQPDIPKILLMGLIAGLACGLGGIFAREQLDRSFHDPEDVEATLGFKVLANIPKIISKAS
ncbi:MAG: putative tyrosine-protein kinase in cps region [Syntrophaceae bacterium PtaU1.Bin231]|nr:MAG: putative tyrosine-protein kinase in cps region [Syntrophaceae bacterium PtaU1.Bin231]